MILSVSIDYQIGVVSINNSNEKRVFISYCRIDENYIIPFIQELEKHHFNIWDYRQIIIGNVDVERNQVKQAIIDCEVIFAFLS